MNSSNKNNSNDNQNSQTMLQHQTSQGDLQQRLVAKHAYTPRNNNPEQPATQLTTASLRALQAALPHQPQNSQFTPETWWIVDRQYRPRLQHGATPLVMRCMRVYGWSEAHARRVLVAYKQFLQLKTMTQDWDGTQLEPSKEINRLWQQHILDVVNYVYDCILLCGRVLGHLPDADEYYVERRQRRQNTKEALESAFAAHDVDDEIWREVVMMYGNGEEGEMQDTYESNHEDQRQQDDERNKDSSKDPPGSDEAREKNPNISSPRRSSRPVRPKMLSRRDRRARSPRRESHQSENTEHIVETPNKVEPKLTSRVAPKTSIRPEEERFSSPSRQDYYKPQQNEKFASPRKKQPVLHYADSRPKKSSQTFQQTRTTQCSQEEKLQRRSTTPVLDAEALYVTRNEVPSAFRAMGGDGRECRTDTVSARDVSSRRISHETVQSFEEIEVELEQCDRGFDPIDAQRQKYQKETRGGQSDFRFNRSSPNSIIESDNPTEEEFSPQDIDVPSLNTPIPEERVKIHIRDRDGVVISSGVRRNTRMIKIFAAYAADKGVKLSSLHFFLHGRTIEASDTPYSLNLRDYDKIECVMGHPHH